LKLVFTSAAQRQHKGLTQFLIGRMDKIIATNAASAAYLKVPNLIVPHGIDTHHFVPNATVKSQIRAHLKAETDQKIIGCFGRIRHQKGTDLFVDAMIELLPRNRNWIAIVCGRVTQEHAKFGLDLERRISVAGLSDRFRFLGEVADILPYYQTIDLYVAPSRNEGFGLTPLEAMSCGVPVVASTAGAYSDMIQSGINGEISEAGNGSALTMAIEKMLRSGLELAAIGRRAQTQVYSHFALNIEAGRLNQLYASLSGTGAEK
jgi:mannosyltransferase